VLYDDVVCSRIGYELLVGEIRFGNLLGALDRQAVTEVRMHRVLTGRSIDVR
jgi:hypothetical protein